MCSTVEKLTDGKFKIQIFQPGEIVPGLASYDAVESNTVDMAFTASYFSMGKEPAFALGSGIPYGGNARIQNAWLHHGGLDLLNDFYKARGTIMFPAGNTGAQMAGWFRKEIKSKQDLVGLRMRVGGLGGVVLSKLGVVPQQLGPADTYTALEKGTIDAAELTGPFDDENLGFAKIAPYYYFPSFAEGGTALGYFINLNKWNELPAPYQEAIRTASGFAAAEVQSRYDAEQTAPFAALSQMALSSGKCLPTSLTQHARQLSKCTPSWLGRAKHSQRSTITTPPSSPIVISGGR